VLKSVGISVMDLGEKTIIIEFSVVSDYRLDDRGSIPAEADFSSSLCIQIGSEAHPASCPMGTGGAFPGVKRGRVVTLTTHPHLVPRSIMNRTFTSSPPWRLHGGSGTALLLLFTLF
jgi:hypothetical protein